MFTATAIIAATETFTLLQIGRVQPQIRPLPAKRTLAEVFGLTISEGAIANILARAQAPLLAAAAPIADAVRASPGRLR